MAKKKQPWAIDDVIAIPMSDGRSAIGQIVGREAQALNSATVALLDVILPSEESTAAPSELDPASVYSVVFVTRDLLDSGRWRVIGRAPVVVAEADQPYRDKKASGFVGAKIYGSGIVEEFVNAFYGLALWDAFYVPDYLGRMLVAPDKKPVARLRFKGS